MITSLLHAGTKQSVTFIGGMILLFSLSSQAAFSIFGDLFKNDLNVIINTELTEAGEKAGLPSPSNPVYIDGVFYGFNNMGTAYGQQKEPPAEDMVSGIFKELDKQGYIFTTDSHPPTQLITIHWGTMRSIGSGRGASPKWLHFLGGDKLGLEYELVPFGTMDPGLARRGMRSGKEEAIVQAAKKDLYYIQIAAYEFNSAVEGDNPIKYWETRIATVAQGKSIVEALPTMIEIAGPAIGIPNDKPMIRDTSDLDANVTAGDIEVIGTLDEEPNN